MSAALDLLMKLSAAGVEFTSDGERIRWRNSGGMMTPDVVAALAAERSVVIDFLTAGERRMETVSRYRDPKGRAPRQETEFPSDKTDKTDETSSVNGGRIVGNRLLPPNDRIDEIPAAQHPSGGKSALRLVHPAQKLAVAPTPEDPEIYADALRVHGPMSYGMAIVRLGWGGTRAGQAEAALKEAGRIAFDKLGRAYLVSHI